MTALSNLSAHLHSKFPVRMACANDAPLKCLICGEQFQTEQNLQAHVEENYVPLEVRFAHEPNTMRYFKTCRPCQACQIYTTFSSITEIMIHFQRTHPEEVTRASIRLTNFLFDALEDPWTCWDSICPYLFHNAHVSLSLLCCAFRVIWNTDIAYGIPSQPIFADSPIFYRRTEITTKTEMSTISDSFRFHQIHISRTRGQTWEIN